MVDNSGAEKPHILLVDDEPALLSTLARGLRAEFDLTCVGDGAAALQLLDDSGPFDLVMSDNRMPGITGVEVLAHAHRVAPRTGRVLFTATDVTAAFKKQVAAAHLHRFIVKPLRLPEIRRTIRDVLAMTRPATDGQQPHPSLPCPD